ncbi:MAG: adenylosuccinate lyase [Actinobacteria bacterium]|nr:adenylosuccinate lyase [Actinomycetota bacterium]
MIDRYTRPQMAAIFSEQAKLEHWLQIEILATEVRAERGEVPAEDLEVIKQKAAFDVERVKEIERKTRHDVAAFLDNLSETIGPAAKHLHYGMTSSDVLDTTLALQLREASDLLLEGLDRLIEVTIAGARRHARAFMSGRTHGVHAEPTTFGLKMTGWAFELDRGRGRLRRAREAVSAGKLSGVVGTFSALEPGIEAEVCKRLGLQPDPASTQVIARDRHAELSCAMGILAGTLDRIATEIRHLARTEVAEVAEPFATGEQKGSSAMPHKRNPWRCERLSGMARIVRAGITPALENMALWHERDISHSSVERVMLPDACTALDFMLAEATVLLEGLVVDEKRMLDNMEASYGLMFSHNLLLKLIDRGMQRDEAYRVVQKSSSGAWQARMHLRTTLSSIPEVTTRMSPAEIDDVFDEERYLEHVDHIINRLSEIEGAS